VDIVPESHGDTWTLHALTDRGAKFFGLSQPGSKEYSAAEAQQLCLDARAAGLKVGPDF